jgi:AcrR family transcriptional regulator
VLRGTILAAATDLLAEVGKREAVSVRAVAERVGVTTPSIYLHFKDKDDLLDAVCASVFESLGAALQEAAAQASTPLERLLAQGRAYVRFALDKPEHYRLAFMVSGHPKSVDDVLTDCCFQQFLKTVEECIESDVLPKGPLVTAYFEALAAMGRRGRSHRAIPEERHRRLRFRALAGRTPMSLGTSDGRWNIGRGRAV